MDDVSVLILTHNEESNISKCIESILPLTNHIYVVDSGSNDKTVEYCEKYGVNVAIHEWKTYADQFNWGLDNFNFETEWLMRMDADEELTTDLVAALKNFFASPDSSVHGVYIRRRVYFMGRWIKHGGYYPTWLLRVFRNGSGRCEALWMDEHIVLSDGKTINVESDIIDKNNKDLTFWTNKHNRYASREVLDVIENKRQADDGVIDGDLRESQASSRRWMKDNIYYRMPLFIRPMLYFVYRYFMRFGFLDGKEGLVFHFLQGFWYRFLVDAKLYEYEKKNKL